MPSKQSAFVPSGKLWPTGEWSLGYSKHRSDDPQWFHHLADSPDGWLAKGKLQEGRPEGPLDLRNVSNSHKNTCPRRKRGSKGITGNGRKMVKSVGALINRNYRCHRVTFATITMPSLPRQLRRELALCWPELVRQLIQWLSRHLERQGLPKVVVSVSEIQQKRLEESREAYLHLHLLWLNHPGRAGNWAVDVRKLKAFVSRFMFNRGIWAEGAYVNTDVRAVKKDVSGYLAKYLSKGSDAIEPMIADLGADTIPSTWWNLSGDARKWVKKNTYSGRVVGEILEAMLEYFWSDTSNDFFRYIYHVELQCDSGAYTVGWRGCFWERHRQELTGVLKSL